MISPLVWPAPKYCAWIRSEPTLGQTAWSRQIAYDADWVMALGRATNSDIIECVFRKNRNGFMGDFLVQVDFDRGYYRYKDYEDKAWKIKKLFFNKQKSM